MVVINYHFLLALCFLPINVVTYFLSSVTNTLLALLISLVVPFEPPLEQASACYPCSFNKSYIISLSFALAKNTKENNIYVYFMQKFSFREIMWPKLVTPLALAEEGIQYSSMFCYSIFYPIIIFKHTHIEMCEVICPSSCLACDLNHVLLFLPFL